MGCRYQRAGRNMEGNGRRRGDGPGRGRLRHVCGIRFERRPSGACSRPRQTPLLPSQSRPSRPTASTLTRPIVVDHGRIVPLVFGPLRLAASAVAQPASAPAPAPRRLCAHDAPAHLLRAISAAAATIVPAVIRPPGHLPPPALARLARSPCLARDVAPRPWGTRPGADAPAPTGPAPPRFRREAGGPPPRPRPPVGPAGRRDGVHL
jgi:hypothetical protein